MTIDYLPLQYNSAHVEKADSKKHLGLILDSKLNFNEHIQNKTRKCKRIKGLVKKTYLTLSR